MEFYANDVLIKIARERRGLEIFSDVKQDRNFSIKKLSRGDEKEIETSRFVE